MHAHLADQAIEGAGAPDPFEALGVGRHPAPPGRELGSDLEMKLQPVRALEAKGLVRIGRRAGQQRRAVGQVEAVTVPLERGEFPRRAAEHRVLGGSASQLHGQQAHLGLVRRVDAGSEGSGQHLRAQAYAPDRVAGPSRLSDLTLLLDEPGMSALLVGPHGPAHDDGGRKVPPVGQRIALVELTLTRSRPRERSSSSKAAGGSHSMC